jgi:hypothetical protein
MWRAIETWTGSTGLIKISKKGRSAWLVALNSIISAAGGLGRWDERKTAEVEHIPSRTPHESTIAFCGGRATCLGARGAPQTNRHTNVRGTISA